MKKWLSLLLATLLFVSLSLAVGGCDKKRPVKEITLNFWHMHAEDTHKVPIQEAVQRFMDATPGVTVHIHIYGDDRYQTKLEAVAEADFPDVFESQGGDWLQSWITAGTVADLTSVASAEKEQIQAGAFFLTAFEEKIFGLPLYLSPVVLYYNQTIFAQNHLKIPQTWSELEAVCNQLLQKEIVPFAMDAGETAHGAQHLALLAMRLGGADIFAQAIAGTIDFTDAAFVQAGSKLQEMVQRGYFAQEKPVSNDAAGQARAMFYQGKSAMLVQNSDFLALCRAEDRDFYQNQLGVASYPTIAGGKGQNTDVLSGGQAISVHAGSKNIEMATRLIVFLATDPSLQKAFVANGALTAHTGIEGPDACVKDVMTQVENATYIQNLMDRALAPELAHAFITTTRDLYNDILTPIAAAQNMQTAYDAAKS